MSEIEYRLEFDDPTMLEARDGHFEKVKYLMEKELMGYKKWMLESKLYMSSNIGGKIFSSVFVLHFYNSGDIYIMDYMPSSEEMFANPDINGLYLWAVDAGWKRIIPCEDLVREKTDFWKHFWEVHVIDSEYLDKNFGSREKNDSDSK